MIRSTFSFGVSIPDSSRTSSSTVWVRFCASSITNTSLRPASYCSTRNSLRVASSSAFFILNGLKPNCTSTDCRNSSEDTWVWLICATMTSFCSSCRKVSISVVLPQPISPLITTKPSANHTVDSM